MSLSLKGTTTGAIKVSESSPYYYVEYDSASCDTASSISDTDFVVVEVSGQLMKIPRNKLFGTVGDKLFFGDPANNNYITFDGTNFKFYVGGTLKGGF